MWRATEADGSLSYSFVESVKSSMPFYAIRLIGGALYLCGMFVMAYNVYKTVVGETAVNPEIPNDHVQSLSADAVATA
jgi:cytochrome c oxidase cbb3-type subunit 1